MSKIKLERWKSYDFILNYTDEFGKQQRVVWLGAKGDKPTVVEVEEKIFEYLAHYTKTFESGELRVADAQENKKEVVEQILDTEAYENNAKTKTEIIDLLKKSNNKKLETELNKITDRSAKQFTYSVFEEIKSDLVGSKIEIVNKWFGVSDEE